MPNKEGLERLHKAVDGMQRWLQYHADTLLEIRPRLLESGLSHANKERLGIVLDDLECGDLGRIWKGVVRNLREALFTVDAGKGRLSSPS